MSHAYDSLPRRIPEGTRYIVEGEPVPGGSRITAAYLIFPNGQRIDLPADSTRIMTCACASVARPGQPRRAKKTAHGQKKRSLTNVVRKAPAAARKRAAAARSRKRSVRSAVI